MNYKNILFQTTGEITTITINRPDKLNAPNKDTIQELHQAFQHADDDKHTKQNLLTASGEKALVAGADLSEFAHLSVTNAKQLRQTGRALLCALVANLATPGVALTNGVALGAGLQPPRACHFTLASNNATMAPTEVAP